MGSPEFDIFAVHFEPEGIVIQYVEVPTDVRNKGHLAMQRTLRLDFAHPDYQEDGDTLKAKVVKILRNALEDFAESEPFDPTIDQVDEDDDRGMGDPR